MSGIFWLASFLIVFVATCWSPRTAKQYAVGFGSWLFLFLLFGPQAPLIKLLLLGVFGGAGYVLYTRKLRLQYITSPIMSWFKKILPPLSESEKTALQAGTVWWEGELFRGRPNWDKLLAVPTPGLSPEEQAFLDGPVEEFCSLLNEWEISHELADLPPKAWAFLKKNKFFGMVIPEEYGGLGFSAVAHAAVLRKIASTPAGMTAGSIVAVPNSLGPAELLLKYGTAKQQKHYLPRLAKGLEIPCFALTSPYAGSDAGSIPDQGVICYGQWEGEEVLGMRLSWDKRYITLAPVATVLGLAVQLRDPEHLLGEQDDIGITCCLIPANLPGVEIGERHLPLNAPFMNGPTRGQDIFVPLDMIIGGPARAGQGWRMLTECLAVGRAISLPAGSAGTLLGLSRRTGAYAALREQFGRPIGQFEGVAEALAELGMNTYAADALSQMTAGAVDLGEKPSVPSAIAKYHCTEMMQRGSKLAMDITAGKGVMLGPNNWTGRAYQSAPVHITVEGANILTRSMIIYGQGAIRCHPYAQAQMQAAADDDIESFDDALFGHIRHVYSVGVRSFALALSDGRLSSAPAGSAQRHYQKLARYSASLAILSDLCLASLGGQLKFKESISGRLADVLSQLYIASAVLKRYKQEGHQSADWPLVHACCQRSYVLIEQALDGVIRHLPNRLLAIKARLLIFPLGRHAKAAKDSDLMAIAKLMQNIGSPRERLCGDDYLARNAEGEALNDLETALRQREACQSLRKRVQKAIADGALPQATPSEALKAALDADILTDAEHAQLQAQQDLLASIIAVDAFSTADLAHKKIRARKTK